MGVFQNSDATPQKKDTKLKNPLYSYTVDGTEAILSSALSVVENPMKDRGQGRFSNQLL